MKRFNKKKKFYIILFIIVACVGIGYAYLNATLNINGTAKVNSNTWDIHFTNLQVNSSSVPLSTGDSAAIINSSNNTEVTYTVTLQKPGDFYEFTVDAKNFGTIDGMVESVSSKLGGVEISSTNPLPNYLNYSVTYSDDIPIDSNHLLAVRSYVTYKIRLEYKRDIEISDLPSTVQNISLSFGITVIQADEGAIIKPEWPVIGDYPYTSDTYREKIKIINLDDEINPPENPIESWDIGVSQNGNVMAYITTNASDDTMYDLYIQGDGALYANPNSRGIFAELTSVKAINNMDVLDTSRVTNMSHMFFNTGRYSSSFTLDLGDKFDTSKVTDMSYMFFNTGYSSSAFTLDLGDKFDTSKVTNMSYMFSSTGKSSSAFTLDLGDKFDTSNVTNMSHMFFETGYNSPVFTLDLGDKFDTSKVTDMSSMFYLTGNLSTVFKLDLGDKFDTTKITDMSYMFSYVGQNSSVFSLDLGDKFDTSNVTNMSHMFDGTGYNNSSLELDLSSFNFSNVTDYSFMFGQKNGGASVNFPFRDTQKIYVKNSADVDWIVTHVGAEVSSDLKSKANDNLTRSNVLVKGA